MTKVAVLDELNLDMDKLCEAGAVLKNGGTVVFPTETVYGLGANALDEQAVSKIFEAKGRPQDNPLIVHIADIEDIKKLTYEVSDMAKIIMDKFWPGAITIILKKSEVIPSITSAGLKTIGIRMPSNVIARELIKAAAVPVAAPSANISGRPSPTEVERCIEDLNGRVDYIIGGGNCEVGLESTILDCTTEPPCILRPGAVTLEMLREYNADIYIDPAIMKKASSEIKPKAPGMKYRHYAPKAQLKLVLGPLQSVVYKINELICERYSEANGKIKIGVIATDETKDSYKDAIVLSLGSRNDMSSIGKNLFEVLRKLDDEKVEVIFSEGFEEVGLGIAVMNRLKKSSGYDILKVY